MDATDNHDTEPLAAESSRDGLVDPLAEQMSSVLRLGSRPAAATREAQLVRRFSDTHRPSTATPGPQPAPITVRSRDGLRWLPAPAEQTRTVGSRGADTSEAEPTSTVPLEPHACNAAICAVTKLFETTELLELTLSFLATKEILTLRRTSSNWNATIQQSPQLRLHMFYYPQFMWPADNFQLLPLSLPGLSVELGEPLPLGRWVEVTFTRDAARKISPDLPQRRPRRSRSIFEGLRGGLGPRAGPSTDLWPTLSGNPAETLNSTLQYEDLFITQPPVVAMQAFILPPAKSAGTRDGHSDDGFSDEEEPAARAKLSCDAGITLGFLAETAQSLLTSNKCAVGEDGRSIVFKAIVSFCTSDSAPRKRSFARSVTRIG
ncbi:hypothetical protein LTR36_006414 [Oleoguttula mirabilis]|uniref:F-box protein n=1 Tax=Oleoguttula mirabilis TaxID=1507867 RepID=A0AAV9JUL7_9PEZI|nr:hypothetical protein LTR36_006414 [Oleoguttula mirabilis]